MSRDLKRCSLFHVAALGESDMEDPLLIRILLGDSYLSKELSLNVLKIMRMKLAACEFAYRQICDGSLLSDD